MSEVVTTKTVDEIIEGINQFDIGKIELDTKAQEFLKTVKAYLNCFDELQALYEEVDPSHKLANYDMPDVKLDIQQLSETGEPVKNLAELYDAAETMFPVFVAKIEDLLQQVTSGNPEASGVKFKIPPGESNLKRKLRASEKAQDDYSKKVPGPPESWLYDIVRGSVLFDNTEQLFQFLQVLRADESIMIVKSKNRFRNPTVSGYRDFNLQIQITNEMNISSRKHICELQLHINAIKEGDTRLKSHDYYEFFRKYYAGATDSLKERMDDLKVICKGGSLDMAFLANVLENPLEVDRMTRLADLFEDYMNECQLAIMITNAIRGALEPDDWYMRLGNLLRSQGKFEEALSLYQKALGIYLKALGPNHANVALCYNNMAAVLYNQGKLREAMELHQRALAILFEALGPDHADVAHSYNNMAAVLQNQGQLDAAMKLYQKALDIRSKALGSDHVDVAHSYNNIAILLVHQGKLDEAVELYHQALYIQLKALGADHVDVAASYNGMANVLQSQGKFEEAMNLHQQALDIRLKALGPDHADVANSYNNIGYALCQQEDRLDEALIACQKALHIYLKTLGENHSYTANTLHSIGEILYKQDKLEEAAQVGEKALNLFLQVHGPGHPFAAMGRELMAMIHEKSSKQ